MPVTRRPCVRWNVRTAATVCGPTIASIGPQIEALRAQSDLEARVLWIDGSARNPAAAQAAASAPASARRKRMTQDYAFDAGFLPRMGR